MKLSKECIEIIKHLSEERASRLYDPNSQKVSEVMKCTQWDNRRHNYERGATEALTNPEIYSKAGLISLEQLDDFLKWNEANDVCKTTTGKWIYSLDSYDGFYTTAQLFQIYQEQKEK